LRSVLVAVVAGTCLTCLAPGPGVSAAEKSAAPMSAAPRDQAGQAIPKWRVISRLTVPGKTVVMLSVASDRANDAWATGFAGKRPVIEHWSGRTWKRMTVPAKALAAFDSDQPVAGYHGPPFPVVGASSARNMWTFNELTGAWLHWDGSHWSHGSIPGQPGWVNTAITSELVLGPDDVWAFGARLNNHGVTFPFAARFRGHRWVVTPMPRPRNLLVSAATALSAGDIWAVIGYGGQVAFPAQGNGGALAHWNGRKWNLAALPSQFARHGDPTSIAAVSDHDLWVGGGVPDNQIQLTEAAARWNGTRWQLHKAPAPPSSANCVLRGIVLNRAGPAGLGDCFTDQAPGIRSRLWQMAGGSWSGPARPRLARARINFTDIAAAGHGDSTWAVGFAGNAGVVALAGPVP
jgi:hypothetical protein